MTTARIFKDSRGEFRWQLRADNGEPIADSSEGYKRRGDARHGLDLVLAAGVDTPIELVDT